LDPIPNITIRFATTNDAEAIASVLFESFVESESLYTPEGFTATAITSERIVARIGTPLFTMETRSRAE